MTIWPFLAGLGFFVFGLKLLEESLQELAGRSFKRWVRRLTKHSLLGFINGALATAVLQSSSLVTVMVMAFAGAGILPLRHGLSLIIGANLGTTARGWWVSLIGFHYNLVELYSPLIAVGCIGLFLLGRRFRFFHAMSVTAAMGFVFLGLDSMKIATSQIAQQIDFTPYQSFGPLAFALFGLLMTSIIQSSSAMVMITLAALNAGIISLTQAAAVAVGADLGTTVTALLYSINGTPTKRRVGLAHVLFNLITGAIAFFLISPWVKYGAPALGISDPLTSLVAFHSSFNLLGAILFLPFLGPFERLLLRFFNNGHDRVTQFISRVGPEVPEAALTASDQELRHLSLEILRFNRRVLRLETAPPATLALSPEALLGFLITTERMDQEYDRIKQAEHELILFLQAIQTQRLDGAESKHVQNHILGLRQMVQAAKSAKDVRHNLEAFEKSSSDVTQAFEVTVHENFAPVAAGLERLLSTPRVSFAELATELQRDNELAYEAVNRWIYQHSGEMASHPTRLSTFLNVNREVFSAHRGLLTALRDLEFAGNGSSPASSL